LTSTFKRCETIC